MSKKRLDRDSLKLKAAIEFGSENIYTVRNGGLGPTLVVDAGTKSQAHKMRKLIPSDWEGLYTIVVYDTEAPEYEDDEYLYDPV